jgi:hypothetical protein
VGAAPAAGAAAEAQQPRGREAARRGLVLLLLRRRVRGDGGDLVVLVGEGVLACLRGHRGEEPAAGGGGNLDRRRRPPPRLPEAEPPEEARDEADPNPPEPAAPLVPFAALLVVARRLPAAAAIAVAEQVGRRRRDGRERAGGHPRDVLGRARLRLPHERHRPGLRPVVAERQVGRGALLGEQPLVELAVLPDAQRALRHDDGAVAPVRAPRRRRLVCHHAGTGRHLALSLPDETDVTVWSRSKRPCAPGSECTCAVGGKDAAASYRTDLARWLDVTFRTHARLQTTERHRAGCTTGWHDEMDGWMDGYAWHGPAPTDEQTAILFSSWPVQYFSWRVQYFSFYTCRMQCAEDQFNKVLLRNGAPS